MNALDWLLLVAVVAVPFALLAWLIRIRKRQPDPKGGQKFEGPVDFPGSTW